MNEKIGTVTISEYSRTDSDKGWRSKPDTIEVERVTMEQVKLTTCDDTIGFFRRLGGYEKLERSYTAHGFLPWKLTSIDPGKSIKKIREYSYN